MFVITCQVNYDVLLSPQVIVNDQHVEERPGLTDCFYTFSDAVSNITLPLAILLIAAFLFLLGRIAYAVYNVFLVREIKEFFNDVLKIPDEHIQDYTWDCVKKKLIEVQVSTGIS